MDETRTYGIEIECNTSCTHHELMHIIHRAFRLAGVNHIVNVTGYCHNTDGMNTDTWTIKSDSSTLPGRNCGAYSMGTEIVSPVLKGEDGLQAIKVVCDAIAPYARITKKCGFHVHHGVKERELKGIINNWIRCEHFFMQCLSNSRQENNYCKKWGDKPFLSSRQSAYTWKRQNFYDRYVTLNLDSFWMRNTVEFRCHQGTYEFEKIKNWVIATQRFVDMVELDSTPQNFQELLTVLRGEERVQVNMTTSSTTYNFKQGTKMDIAYRKLQQGITQDELTSIFMNTFQEEDRAKAFHRVRATLSGLRKKGVQITKNGNLYSLAGTTATEERRVNTGSRDVEDSLVWLEYRRNYFESRRAA